jgi:hypothetical protein
MNYKILSAIVSIIAVVSFATSVGSILLQTALAEKPNQCGISGLVHEEQQFVGGVQGGNFGRTVGDYNGNTQFQGSTDAAHEAQTSAATGCRSNP